MSGQDLRERARLAGGKLWAARSVGRALYRTVRDEVREGTLLETLRLSRERKTLVFPHEPTYGELLEERAAEAPGRPYLRFEDQRISVGGLNERANAVAAGLRSLGASSGEVAGIVCGNCPEFLYAFFALQKLGMGCVPVNTALVGEGLRYLVENSQARYLLVHEKNLEPVVAACEGLESLKEIVLITEGASAAAAAKGRPCLEEFLREHAGAGNPAVRPDPESVSLLMYTSGTTGRPKGVVYRFRDSNTKKMRLLGNLLYEESDVLYTCLPLFHANALLLSTMQALGMRAELALGRRFSASGFWSEVRSLGASTFNTLGAMIPILLKQPAGPDERRHKVRLVVSAACPATSWRVFEERFGVRLVEAYAAVDGGGFLTLNLGNAPVGSIGRPLGGARYRLVTEEGRDAAPKEPGELWVFTGRGGERGVEYYRNAQATKQKTRDGWLHTGDLLYRDPKGYLYFVGRNTDSMRRRGENVSAYEVETVIGKHPDVLECAVFGVPSELGEDDIMALLVPIEGRRVDPAQVHSFLRDKLARYAIPRYLEVVGELPKTGTHRVQKSSLRQRGVTANTWDAEKARSRAAAGAA